jgi:hypothetical protein
MPKKVIDDLSLTLDAFLKQHPTALGSIFPELRRVARDFDDHVERAWKDARLTPLGRDEAITAAAKEASVKLATIEQNTLEPLRQNIASIKARLLDRPAPQDASVLLTRGDIRQELERTERRRPIVSAAASLDAAARDALFAGTTDPEILDVLATAAPVLELKPGAVPRFRPMVSPEVRDNVLTARARATNPKLAAELEHAEAVQMAVRTALRTAQELIGRAGTADGASSGRGRQALAELTTRK